MSAENAQMPGNMDMALPEAGQMAMQGTEAFQEPSAEVSEASQNAQEILDLLKEDPEKVAQIVRAWLNE